ncbi:MAG TPA: hypothetical protein VFM59_06555 [Salinimicrobium sp.]|nr:hypothetical protein [Salinimicrobium sp.]
MMKENVPVNEETFEILSFLSGYGFWLLLAIVLVVLVLYKKIKK